MRQVKEYLTETGEQRYRVRYRLAGVEHSETFYQEADAILFRDILGDGRGDRISQALGWLEAKRTASDTETFGQWFETYIRSLSGITPRTVDDYRAMRRRYLAPLDDMPLELITRIHIADLINDLDRRGLSAKTIKNVVHMVSSALGLAVDEGRIVRNPTRRARIPKAKAGDDAAPKFLTEDEAGLLIAHTDVHYQPLVAFLFGSGLRWSEATALQTRHVNLAAGTVRVDRAWKKIPGGWEIGAPKSAKSRRTVNAGVLALLAAEPLLGKPSDLVFTTPRGNVIRHANFYNRVWVPACESAGFDPRPSPHDCRHSFASWLISEGIGLEAVQDQLGHESYETTRKVYAHLLPAVGVAAGRAASAAMERVIAHRAQVGARLAVEAARGPDELGDALDVDPVVECSGERGEGAR